MKLLPALVLLTLASSCVMPLTRTASYEPPIPSEVEEKEWTRTIAKPFDQVWVALVGHVSSSFFAIDAFEKASGLMTLSFGASGIGDFVDGGHWKYRQTAGHDFATGVPYPEVNFDGNYADYAEQHLNATLKGKMNLFIRTRIEGRTQIRVRARYILSTSSGTNVYDFDTGGQKTLTVLNATPNTPPTRTMRPTHMAERSILDAVEKLVKKDNKKIAPLPKKK